MIEQRVRDSLRERAGDVEPTPRLQLEVERRLSRRRRRRALAWATAAAAAGVAAVVVLPALLPGSMPPEVDPVDRAPQETTTRVGADDLAAGARLPSHLVLAVGDDLVLVDVDRAREHPLPSPGGRLLDVAVRPGTPPGDGLEVAYAAEADTPGEAVVGVIDEDGHGVAFDQVAYEEPTVPTLVWDPDGSALAWTAPAEDRWLHHAELPRPVPADADVDVTRELVPPDPREPAGTRGPAVLTDWVSDAPGAPTLLATFGDGAGVGYRLGTSDGDLVGDQAMPFPEGLLARVDASPDRAGPEGGYALVNHGDGLQLVHTTSVDQTELPLPDGLGDRPHRLDAVLDAVTVTDADRGWLITHAEGETAVADLGEVRSVSVVRGAGDEADAAPSSGRDAEPAGAVSGLVR